MRTFETEYQMKEWREIESQHFDSDGKAYKGQNMSNDTQEQMLKLINQLDSELNVIEEENNIMNKMDNMCVESLPTHDFANWERIKESLKLVRKNLKSEPN